MSTAEWSSPSDLLRWFKTLICLWPGLRLWKSKWKMQKHTGKISSGKKADLEDNTDIVVKKSYNVSQGKAVERPRKLQHHHSIVKFIMQSSEGFCNNWD